VTAIRRALEFVAAKDPLALAAAVHAMEVALDVLVATDAETLPALGGAAATLGSRGPIQAAK
jgi:hypothetical protein